jgi:hypothetical protein
MYLHAAMSPLSNKETPLSPVKGYGSKFMFNTKIDNPFADYSGIGPHKDRLVKINDKMNKIQNLYLNHKTLA